MVLGSAAIRSTPKVEVLGWPRFFFILNQFIAFCLTSGHSMLFLMLVKEPNPGMAYRLTGLATNFVKTCIGHYLRWVINFDVSNIFSLQILSDTDIKYLLNVHIFTFSIYF